MDSPSKPPSPNRYEEDKDLNFFIYKIGVAIKNFFLWIGSGLRAIGRGLNLLGYFLLKNLLWLLLGAVIGFAYGYYLYKKSGARYASDMVVQTNFNSARSLYNAVDYLNTLISKGATNELSKIFKISEKDASTLINFSIEPIKNQVVVSDMYYEQFLQELAGTAKLRQDTFWTRTLPYKDFKSNLTKFDYPIHEVSAFSYNALIFNKLQNGIVELIDQNVFLQKAKRVENENDKEEVRLLSEAIEGLDTLRHTYNLKLQRGDAQYGAVDGRINVDNIGLLKTPELDLYDKLLEIKDQLKVSRRRSALNTEIIEVQSGFNSPGRKLSFFREDVPLYTFAGVILVIFISLFIRFIRFFLEFQKRPRRI